MLGFAHGVFWGALSEGEAFLMQEAAPTNPGGFPASPVSTGVCGVGSSSGLLPSGQRRTKKIKKAIQLTPEALAAGRARYKREWMVWEASVRSMGACIVDLGNACWTHKHFSEDIQTRQYRSPEVILGGGYNESADIWSLGAMIFECLTGDLLFDPSAGEGFERDEDHLAQMQELLGPMPLSVAARGVHAHKFFSPRGELLHIRELKYWSPSAVLREKYGRGEAEAAMVQAFLLSTLTFSPSRRATAMDCLHHPWLAPAAKGGDASGSDGGAALLHPPPAFVDWGGDPELTLNVLRDLKADGFPVQPPFPRSQPAPVSISGCLAAGDWPFQTFEECSFEISALESLSLAVREEGDEGLAGALLEEAAFMEEILTRRLDEGGAVEGEEEEEINAVVAGGGGGGVGGEGGGGGEGGVVDRDLLLSWGGWTAEEEEEIHELVIQERTLLSMIEERVGSGSGTTHGCDVSLEEGEVVLLEGGGAGGGESNGAGEREEEGMNKSAGGRDESQGSAAINCKSSENDPTPDVLTLTTALTGVRASIQEVCRHAQSRISAAKKSTPRISQQLPTAREPTSSQPGPPPIRSRSL